MKIKMGQPGAQEEMLEKDKARLSEIHAAIGHLETPHTKSGKIPYYFDANGRYESRETLQRLLDHARTIGAFEQIAPSSRSPSPRPSRSPWATWAFGWPPTGAPTPTSMPPDASSWAMGPSR
jgi:hypothetical protein